MSAEPKPTMRAIIEHVAAKHRLTVEDLKGPSRVRRLADARCEAIYEMDRMGLWSTTQVGRSVNRTHWMVLHARDVHPANLERKARKADPELKRLAEHLAWAYGRRHASRIMAGNDPATRADQAAWRALGAGE